MHVCMCVDSHMGVAQRYVFMFACVWAHRQGLYMDIRACLHVCGCTRGGYTWIYMHVWIVWVHIQGLYMDKCSCLHVWVHTRELHVDIYTCLPCVGACIRVARGYTNMFAEALALC